jgi:hypothetical protein
VTYDKYHWKFFCKNFFRKVWLQPETAKAIKKCVFYKKIKEWEASWKQ